MAIEEKNGEIGRTMKCEHCGGAIIVDPGCYPEGPTKKCMNCGREPKEKKIMETEKRCVSNAQKRSLRPRSSLEGAKLQRTASKVNARSAGRNILRIIAPEKGREQNQTNPPGQSALGRRPAADSKPKRKYIRQSNPVASAPVISASPAEIVIALRKGMAAEIVAMIKEKFEL